MLNSDENLVEFLPLSTACVDASGVYRRVNRAYELTCGVSRHQLVGQHFKRVLSIWLAEDQCQVAVRNLEIALSGTSALFDTVLWAENGIHHVELSYTPVLGPEGSVAGVVETWDAFPAPDRPALESHYTRLLKEGTHHFFSTYHREPLNRWFEHRLYPTQDGLIGYLHDITDRRTAEEAVRLHKQAIASVPLGISIASYDPQSDYPLVYANDRSLSGPPRWLRRDSA